MALLDIRNLTVEIETDAGYIKLIDNMSLTVKEGEICGLIGESGSGKSLIAKIICNTLKPSWKISADRFRFKNIELLKLSSQKRRKLIRREIAMISQDPLSCLDPSRTIGKQLISLLSHLSYQGKWFNWFGWKKRRIIELLHRIGIKDHHDIMRSYPKELTEGEAQKIVIAMALINQPSLLVADEPTYSLEATAQLQVFKLLTSMNKNLGSTILLTDSDIKNISEWCDSFTVLYCGQTVESGSKDNIMEKPHHPYTYQLLNAIPDFKSPLPFKHQLNAMRGSIPLLNHLPIGCRFAPRCPFSQKSCTHTPPLKRIKQHEFSCYYPMNIRNNHIDAIKITPSPLTIDIEQNHLED